MLTVTKPLSFFRQEKKKRMFQASYVIALKSPKIKKEQSNSLQRCPMT